MKSIKELKSIYYLYLIVSIVFSVMIISAIVLLIIDDPVFFDLEESTFRFYKICIYRNIGDYRSVVCI